MTKTVKAGGLEQWKFPKSIHSEVSPVGLATVLGFIHWFHHSRDIGSLLFLFLDDVNLLHSRLVALAFGILKSLGRWPKSACRALFGISISIRRSGGGA